MEYYVAQAGEKVGPLSQFKLAEMLRDGELSADHKTWHAGMDGWLPMSEIPSLKTTLESIEKAEEKAAEADAVPEPGPAEKKTVPVAAEVRPLTRFWARQFDYTIVFVIVIIFSDFELPKIDDPVSLSDVMSRSWELAESEEYLQIMKMVIFAIPMWHLIEGIMLSIFGTTPGKALFGIHVITKTGLRPPIMTCIYRSFLVYILGVGLFCFSLITFIAMAFSFFRLMSKGICLWDQVLDLRVKHPPLSFARILLAIVAFITLMMLQNLNFS